MTEGKFIDFLLSETKPKTEVYDIVTKQGDPIGKIKWYSQWRRYCFYPKWNTVWDQNCLTEITGFISELMSSRDAKSISGDNHGCNS